MSGRRAAVSYATRFTAEHRPPGRPRHANEFRLVVTVAGPIVGGMVVDFDALAAEVTLLARTLEAVPPAEAMPSSSVEEVAVWIWGQLAPRLPGLVEVRLADGPFEVVFAGERV